MINRSTARTDAVSTASSTDTLRAAYRAFRHRFADMSNWKTRDYASPSPKKVKDCVLLRNALPQATWVETGTFLGETTELLAKHAQRVISLEPATTLFARAAKKFAGNARVEIVNGPSETVFPDLLPTLSGPVNFWLDGHFSAGATFQGQSDTPIITELAQIEANLEKLSPVRVLIDDIRCFDPALPHYAGYPTLDVLVDWARRNALHWHIEHDIFVARTPDHVE